jgi:hypothetical protein
MSESSKNNENMSQNSSEDKQKVVGEVVENVGSNSKNSTNNSQEINLENIIKFLDLYLVQKAPSLPKNVKDFCFKWLPLFNKIGIGLLFFVSFLSLFLILFNPTGVILSLIANAIVIAYSFMAIPHLEKNEYKGWEKLLLGNLLSFLVNLVSNFVDVNLSGIIFLIIFQTISLYILFQIRSFYKVVVI